MDYTKDVVGFETFTKKEIEKKILKMEMAEFHGKSTNIKTAIEHAEQVLEVFIRLKGYFILLDSNHLLIL
jgi:hypothetical protein